MVSFSAKQYGCGMFYCSWWVNDANCCAVRCDLGVPLGQSGVRTKGSCVSMALTAKANEASDINLNISGILNNVL